MRAGADRAWLALRFHETLAAVVERSCLRARDLTGLTQVALSGGCFQNRILTGRALARLAAAGFTVFLHREVPPNDSGLALGQAAVASARLRSQTGA